MRKIPATMTTQHPDNAWEAYWCGKSFINTTDEIEEVYKTFKDLDCDEYMWDWEGKFVDEAVIDKLFRKYTEYFKKKQLGKDKFLTYRIPNIWEESGYRIARAFINIVTSADFAEDFKFHTPPVFEVILPMTKTAEQVSEVEDIFSKVAKLKCEIFNKKGCDFCHINVIPLIESVEQMTKIPEFLEKYLFLYKNKFKKYPEYLRPFIARSDPALNSGIVPAVIAAKAAISQIHEVGEKYGIKMYPIIGTGSLPFRGGVNPENIKEVIQEYAGINTITVQSAFKYDYPLPEVKKAIKFINKTLPKLKPTILSKNEIRNIEELNKIFSYYYKNTVEPLAHQINKLSKFIPARRERMQHIGLFGYSRGMGKVKLPRAITFTSIFYSLGIPPEFIGTGRGLMEAKEKGLLPLLKKIYLNLERDLSHSGKYLNIENLNLLAKKNIYFRQIIKDIYLAEKILGIKFGPQKAKHILHRNHTSNIYYKMKMKANPEVDIIEAAKIRKSMG